MIVEISTVEVLHRPHKVVTYNRGPVIPTGDSKKRLRDMRQNQRKRKDDAMDIDEAESDGDDGDEIERIQTRPTLNTKGHTGYLTFALTPLLEEVPPV